jgi:hypothetical protein
MRRLSADAEQAAVTNAQALPGLLDALEREFETVKPLLIAARPGATAAS